MSRRIIIILLVVLIVGTVLGTGYFIVKRLNSTTTKNPTASTTPGALTPGGQVVKDPTADPDHDGLNNSDEATWGTDPNNPDTDGDKYLDGEEVKAGHNPTIPAPNDKLPEGFVPGKSVQPLSAADSEPIAVDQFFQKDLDLTLGSKNYTDEYRAQYAQDKRTPDTLETYAKSQPIISQLPTPEEKSIQAIPDDTPLVLKDYIDVAGDLSVFSNPSILSDGISSLFGKNDPRIIQGLAETTRTYQQNLIQLKVPPSGVALQKLLLGYSQLVAATYDQIAAYPTDQARSIVAMRQLAENDKKYMPLISKEVDRLRAVSKQKLGQ